MGQGIDIQEGHFHELHAYRFGFPYKFFTWYEDAFFVDMGINPDNISIFARFVFDAIWFSINILIIYITLSSASSPKCISPPTSHSANRKR